MRRVRVLLLAAAAALSVPLLGIAPANAGGLCSSLALSCENGHTYPFCPIAVSDEGEIATGQLVLGGRRGVHMRLVPMGAGYRYIGTGIYFEGMREAAVLYLRKDSPIACIVVRE